MMKVNGYIMALASVLLVSCSSGDDWFDDFEQREIQGDPSDGMIPGQPSGSGGTALTGDLASFAVTIDRSALSEQAISISSDDEEELEQFKKRKYQYMAKDKEGRDVFLADSGYMLQMAQQDFKHLQFHFTSEF